MKTNVEALKDLYIASGGKAEDVADLYTNAEMIEALATLKNGGSPVVGEAVVGEAEV
jgi:hypothetical protein